MISWQQRFVNFRWGKEHAKWLFLIELLLTHGGGPAGDVNAAELPVDMDTPVAIRL